MTKKWLFSIMIGINIFIVSCQATGLNTNGINLDYIEATSSEKAQIRLSQASYVDSIHEELKKGTLSQDIEETARKILTFHISNNNPMLDDTTLSESLDLISSLEKASRRLPTIIRVAHKLRVAALSINANALPISKRTKLRKIASKGQAIISRVGRALRSQQNIISHTQINSQTHITDYFKR